jgi:hypothetical protein
MTANANCASWTHRSPAKKVLRTKNLFYRTCMLDCPLRETRKLSAKSLREEFSPNLIDIHVLWTYDLQVEFLVFTKVRQVAVYSR